MSQILSEKDFRNIRTGLLKIAQQSYKIGILHPRSNQKLRPLHGYIADTIMGILDQNFEIHSLYPECKLLEAKGQNTGKEDKISGAYYDKQVDIALYDKRENRKPVLIVAVKFVLSNYRQNATNYFENSIGESANLQMKGCPVLHFLCLPNPVPYKKRGGKGSSLEKIGDHHIAKYRKLVSESEGNQKHVPHGVCINIFELDIGSANEIPKSSIKDHQNIDELDLSRENRHFLTKEASLRGFFELVMQIARHGGSAA